MWTSAAGYNLKLFTDFNVSKKKQQHNFQLYKIN